MEDAIQGDRGQYRQEKEQAAKLRVERARAQVELPDIGNLSSGRPQTWWTLIIGLAWQASETFILEDLGNGDRTEAAALVGQIMADIVDREVLFADVITRLRRESDLGADWGPLAGVRKNRQWGF